MMIPSVCEQLHSAAAPVWEKCMGHPFVRGIGDGTLVTKRFRFYMLQDYLYLFEYARVFALGVTKARDPELMRFFAKNVDAILDGEMKIHRAYMARLGIAEEEVFAVQPSLDNISYTNYMLSVASTGTPADIIASILACSWSYAEIGQELAKLPGALEHPFYGEWVSGYAGAEYAETNAALMRRMDELACDCTQAQLDRLTEIFVNCSRYELAFWDMAWEMRV